MSLLHTCYRCNAVFTQHACVNYDHNPGRNCCNDECLTESLCLSCTWETQPCPIPIDRSCIRCTATFNVLWTTCDLPQCDDSCHLCHECLLGLAYFATIESEIRNLANDFEYNRFDCEDDIEYAMSLDLQGEAPLFYSHLKRMVAYVD